MVRSVVQSGVWAFLFLFFFVPTDLPFLPFCATAVSALSPFHLFAFLPFLVSTFSPLSRFAIHARSGKRSPTSPFFAVSRFPRFALSPFRLLAFLPARISAFSLLKHANRPVTFTITHALRYFTLHHIRRGYTRLATSMAILQPPCTTAVSRA